MSKKNNNQEDNYLRDLPLGFGMALARNTNALDKFATMTSDKQKELVEGAKKVSSKKEMKAYVENIGQVY